VPFWVHRFTFVSLVSLVFHQRRYKQINPLPRPTADADKRSMSELPAAGFSWICPACGRRVPNKVTTCRCGHEADPAVLATEPAVAEPLPPEPREGGRQAAVLVAVAIVIAGAIGGLVWRNRARRETPTTTSAEVAAPEVRSAASDAAPALETPPPAPAPPPVSVPESRPESSPVVTTASAASNTSESLLSFEDIITRALPAVVRVESPGGFGTGFFVRADTILTNVHVVTNNVSVTIRRADGATAPARVESTTPELDIAVLHVDNALPGQPTIPLGSGVAARAGQEVIALGSPLGLQNTVTRGIVSAVRRVNAVTLVQTDAAINPGNSGGPLINRSGAAIGITTLGMRSAVAQGLSFAVAIDHAADLLAGKRPSGAAGTPLASLNQAMTPPRQNAPSEVDRQREEMTRAFQKAVAQIARRADDLDSYWGRFRASCYQGRIAATFDREWFALFDARAMQGAVSPGCGPTFGDVRRVAFEIRDEVRATEEAARQADIYPGVRRDVWRKYRLDYAGWDR
jgi:S1-C subfamily serine protease